MAIDIERDAEHRFTLDEYHRLIEAGAFDECPRAELIDGWLILMSPRSAEHERLVSHLARWAITNTDPAEYEVRVAGSLTFDRSEPEPDISVIGVGTPEPYHPGRADLVVEVSLSSLRHDLILKSRLYATAGVIEYWVVDIAQQRVVVHRLPSDGVYHEISEHRDGPVASAAVALPPLDVEALMAIAYRR